MYRVLEVNVDDTGYGGVFSLVKGVIAQKQQGECIDIAAIEKFENQSNIDDLNKYGCKVNYIGFTGNKIFKQFVCFNNLRKLIKKEKYDCVHIHADVANKLLVSGLASKTAGVKKIILHSHAAGVDGNHRKLKVFMHKGCRGLLKAIGTDYVACSDLAAHWMFPGVPEKYITIIKNGVDLDRFRYNEDSRQEVRRELGLKNVKTIHSRAEDGARKPELREKFDIATSRAVANMAVLSEFCMPYVKKGGYFVALKGPSIDEELENGSNAIKILGGELKDIIEISIEETDLKHNIVEVKKIKTCPKTYPRKAGTVNKKPLQ